MLDKGFLFGIELIGFVAENPSNYVVCQMEKQFWIGIMNTSCCQTDMEKLQTRSCFAADAHVWGGKLPMA